MGDKTNIQWTDSTWNAVSGCDPVSEGCDNCYAEAIAHRFGAPAFPNGFGITYREHKLTDPLRWTPRKVFVDSMSDLFTAGISDDFIAKTFAVMACSPHHIYQILTKRPGRMRSLLNNPEFISRVTDHARKLASTWKRPLQISWKDPAAPTALTWPLPNVWLGVSAESQKWATVRIPLLLDCPAVIHFVSAEPLLSALNLGVWPHLDEREDGYPRIAWVIAGGESGPKARPMHPDWARSLRDQCANANTAFFFKQWGAWAPAPDTGRGAATHQLIRADGTPDALEELTATSITGPDRPRIRKYPMHAAGNILDGRTHTEFPAPAPSLP